MGCENDRGILLAKRLQPLPQLPGKFPVIKREPPFIDDQERWPAVKPSLNAMEQIRKDGRRNRRTNQPVSLKHLNGAFSKTLELRVKKPAVWPTEAVGLKRALQPYCLGGPHGRLLDAEFERLGREGSVQVFETDGLIGTAVAPAVLSYLFHRIEGRLDGRPTLLIIDEGWLALDNQEFAGQLREWLKTLRKKNTSVVFATQSLADIDGSAIAPAIIESCPTRILLPNDRAIEPQITAIYRRFGLNDRQIEILARATPKRDYYCQSRRGNRLFELGLGEVALAFTAASSKADQVLIDRVLAEDGRDNFVPGWLRARDISWATDLIPHLTELEASK